MASSKTPTVRTPTTNRVNYNTSISIPIPATAQVGELIFIGMAIWSGVFTLVNNSQGWSAVENNGISGQQWFQILWQGLVGGLIEPGGLASFTTTVAPEEINAVLLSIAGAHGTASAVNEGQAQTSQTIVAPSVTTTDTDALLLSFFGCGPSQLFSGYPSTQVTSITDVVGSFTRLNVGSGKVIDAGASGTRVVTMSNSAMNSGQHVAIQGFNTMGMIV